MEWMVLESFDLFSLDEYFLLSSGFQLLDVCSLLPSVVDCTSYYKPLVNQSTTAVYGLTMQGGCMVIIIRALELHSDNGRLCC